MGWFRVEVTRWAAPLDQWDEPTGRGTVSLRLEEYDVRRVTPKGVWLDIGFGGERFVRLGARKRWACPTVAEAWESFRARKRIQLRILRAQAEEVEELLRMAEGKP